jgi:hypothetical protein
MISRNPWETTRADFWAGTMPIVSAILAAGAGTVALVKLNDGAAIFGIAAALASAIGVKFTGIASRKRDDQIRFWIEAAGEALAHIREGFGS